MFTFRYWEFSWVYLQQLEKTNFQKLVELVHLKNALSQYFDHTKTFLMWKNSHRTKVISFNDTFFRNFVDYEKIVKGRLILSNVLWPSKLFLMTWCTRNIKDQDQMEIVSPKDQNFTRQLNIIPMILSQCFQILKWNQPNRVWTDHPNLLFLSNLLFICSFGCDPIQYEPPMISPNFLKTWEVAVKQRFALN